MIYNSSIFNDNKEDFADTDNKNNNDMFNNPDMSRLYLLSACCCTCLVCILLAVIAYLMKSKVE